MTDINTARLAMQQASGIMIWTVVDDTTYHTSLLRAIHAELETAPVP